MSIRTRRAWTGMSLVLLSGTALAQDNAGAATASKEAVKTLLVLDRAELSKVLVDAKDQKLGAALAMLPARLRDLPDEIPQMPRAASQIIDFVLSSVARPAKAAITYGAGNPAHGLWGYGFVVSVQAKDAADANAMHAAVGELLTRADMPPQAGPKQSERIKGMSDMLLPMGLGLLSYGPRESASGWRYEVIVGCLDNPDGAFAAVPPASAGLNTILRGHLDLEQLTPAAQFISTMASRNNPEIREVFNEFTKMGLVGPDALKIDFEDGYTATEHLGRVVIRNIKPVADRYWMADSPLTKAELNLVPADATVASISKTRLSKLGEVVANARAKSPEVAEAIGRFEAQTGVSLEQDVLASLGETVAVYLSDATGGGSLASAVAVVGLKDKSKFISAHDKLMSKANEFFMHMPKGGGYVRISPWEEGGIKLNSLRFTGIPIPLELTYAVAGDFIVASLTAQGALAAARQALGKGDGGLSTNEQFSSVAGGKTPTGVSFVDSARMLRAGYPFVSMIGSAVANGVRSRDGSREPGMVVPLYHDLAKGARPNVQIMCWSGDDYAIETHGDRSVLVRAGSIAGTVTQFWPFIAAAIGGAAAAEHHHGRGMDDGWQQSWFAPAWAAPAGAMAASDLSTLVTLGSIAWTGTGASASLADGWPIAAAADR